MTPAICISPAIVYPPGRIADAKGVIHWGAVFAGIGAGLVVHLLIRALANAPILSALAAAGQRADSAAVVPGAAVWSLASVLLPAAIGAYVASRGGRLPAVADGVRVGAVVWGGTQVLFAAVTLSSLAPGAATSFHGVVEHLAGAPAGRVQQPATSGTAERRSVSPTRDAAMRGAGEAISTRGREAFAGGAGDAMKPVVIADIQDTFGVSWDHALRLAHHFRAYMVLLALQPPEASTFASDASAAAGSAAHASAGTPRVGIPLLAAAWLGSLLLAVSAGAAGVGRTARARGCGSRAG
jgi:hypothetical protein